MNKINVCWNNELEQDYIIVSVNRGWQLDDVVDALDKRRRMIGKRDFLPGTLVQIQGSLGLPPPRLLSRLSRMTLRPLADEEKLVVLAPAHQLAYLSNLLLGVAPALRESILFTSSRTEAIAAFCPNRNPGHSY